MDQSEDQILAAEPARLGAVAAGSGRLVCLVARLMGKNVHEIDMVIPLPFLDTVKRVAGVLGPVGRSVDATQIGHGRNEETIRVVTGGGTAGMNPVVVTALVRQYGDNSTQVRIRAAAKEGLIKQRAGEKTALRIETLLREADGQQRPTPG